MELATSALALGKAVGERAGRAWLTSHTAEANRGKELVELIQVGFIDQIHGRRVARQIDEIADQVAERVLSLCGQEYYDLQAFDKAAAVADVKEALEAADLSDTALFAADMDPAKLAQQIRLLAPTRGTVSQLGEAGSRIYEVVLVDCCDCLLRIIRELTPFTPRALTEVFSRLSELSERVNAALTRLPTRSFDAPDGEADDEIFKRRYLEVVSHNLDALELFGVRVQSYRPRTSLSVAYISLTVSADSSLRQRSKPTSIQSKHMLPWQEDLHTSQGNVRVETALARSRLMLIRGEAGSGKSTILRWIAIAAARGSFTGDLAHLKGCTPFIVKLRSYADERLPRPEELLENLAGIDLSLMPTGWIHRRLASGRSILLVDGVDELKSSQRKNVREWLDSLLKAYPEIYVVVTSRPAAADAKWLAAEGFFSVYLERMSNSDVKLLIHHWHEAARDMSELPCEPERLPGFEAALLARLETTPHLRMLATSPLLAAMLCALNLDHETHLPRDRMGLYSATIEMLLSRRDTQRGIEHDIPISVDNTVHILQDVAWRLSQSNRSELPKEVVLRRVADRLATMPLLKESPSVVLNGLLERSGVLREPVVGRIDFVHRSVQEYLAAKQIADDSDMESLIAVAHQDQWYETVVMVAGHANSADRSLLIKGLLERAESEPKYSRRLKLLISACLETLQSIEPSLRRKVEACLNDLIPPRTSVAAYSLAAVGEFVLDRLPDDLSNLNATQASAVLRTTYLINGPAALERMAMYSSDPRAAVQRELISGWDYFDPEIYAQRVLSNAPLDDGNLSISNPRLMPHLRHIENMTSLSVLGRIRASDLNALSGMPNRLRYLSLARVEGRASLEAVSAQSETLRSLYLGGGPFIDLPILGRLANLTRLVLSLRECKDISFLQDLSGLTHLSLSSLAEVVSVDALRSFESLIAFGVRRCPGLVSIDQLPVLNKVKELRLQYTGLGCNLEDLLDRCPNVSSLDLDGLESIHSLSALTKVSCRHLGFASCTGIADLVPLSSQSELQFLDVEGTSITDLSPLSDLPKLSDIDLSQCMGVSDLTPLAALPRLRRLRLRGAPPELDLTPLVGNDRLMIIIDAGQDIVGGDEFGDRLYRYAVPVEKAGESVSSGPQAST